MKIIAIGAFVMLALSAAAQAQDQSASGAGPAIVEIDPTALTMPVLTFLPTPADEADYDKYFYFHRPATDYATAYADIRECDALSSGSSIYMGNSSNMAGAMAQYGLLGGAVGGAIGGAIADAIFGSAARRQQRRINTRNCMSFKGYQRYPLTGELWKKFNFEEGNGRKKEGVRDDALELQALVASGPQPTTQELGI